MSQLKEQNGKYYQQYKVVMLATNYGKLTLYDYKDLKTLSYALGNHKGSTNLIPQHLYILSDDEIKEGDWVLYKNKPCLVSLYAYSGEMKVTLIYAIKYCKKIIATTDTLIITNMSDSNAVREIDFDIEVPKLSDSFIKKYIEEYNKGSQITKVLVEYEFNQHKFMVTLCTTKEKEYNLKVDSNNTITIKKVKDSYSREEVEKLVINALKTRVVWQSEIDNWIKENL